MLWEQENSSKHTTSRIFSKTQTHGLFVVKIVIGYCWQSPNSIRAPREGTVSQSLVFKGQK